MSRVLLACLIGTLLGGCSVRRFAVNRIGDALASGGSTYERDEDLQLVGDALPFGLKLIESLIAEAPKHRGLLLSACQGFATYSYVYVQHEADLAADSDLDAAEVLRNRARRLFLRAHRYGFRGLEASYPGISGLLTTEPRRAVSLVRRKSDVALLYWNAAALGLAISVSKDDVSMLARIPEVRAMLDRALELDEAWQQGTLHEFQVTFGSAQPGKPDLQQIEKHYRRAAELSGGQRAGLYVAYAESVCVPRQDRECFQEALGKALSIDPYQNEAGRLQNLIAHRRAQWLEGRTADLFLPVEPAEPAPAGDQ